MSLKTLTQKFRSLSLSYPLTSSLLGEYPPNLPMNLLTLIDQKIEDLNTDIEVMRNQQTHYQELGYPATPKTIQKHIRQAFELQNQLFMLKNSLTQYEGIKS